MKNTMLTQLPGSPGCFICDNNGSNPRALGLKLLWDEETRTVHIPCLPDQSWCGYNNIVHGGLIASIMDEGMSWAVKTTVGDWAFTADFHLRYKKTLESGREYLVKANVVEDAGRKIMAEAIILDSDGQLCAKATATFLPVKGRATPRSAT